MLTHSIVNLVVVKEDRPSVAERQVAIDTEYWSVGRDSLVIGRVKPGVEVAAAIR